MSVTVEVRTVDPGSDEHVAAAWDLKERINDREGVLKQRRDFFENAYRRSTVYCCVASGSRLVGFAAVRRDGYILFLAVDPDWRSQGIGRLLVGQVAEDQRSVTCHARTSNENALQFYEHLGFDITRRIDGYYEDGGDAYYLKLGEDTGIADRISDLVGR